MMQTGQHNVIDVVGQTLNQPRVFLPLQRLSEISSGGGHKSSKTLQRLRDFIFLAAYSTAWTMCWYPVQRHRLPDSA